MRIRILYIAYNRKIYDFPKNTKKYQTNGKISGKTLFCRAYLYIVNFFLEKYNIPTLINQ